MSSTATRQRENGWGGAAPESVGWTTHQAAAFLNVSKETVRRFVRDGRLEAKRLGRFVRLDPEDVKAMLK